MILDSMNVSSAVNEMDELELNNLALETAVYVAESWTDVMVGISQDEFKAYVESGELQPMTEGALETVKNWIKKIWEKIKSFFSKVIAKVRGWLNNSKSFYTKYQSEIEAGAGLVKDFKGYKYSGMGKAFDKVGKVIDLVKDMSSYDNASEKDKFVENKLKAIRKSIAGGTGEAGDFGKDLSKSVRGADSKTVIKLGASDLKAMLYSDSMIKDLTYGLRINENALKRLETDVEQAAKADTDAKHKSGFGRQLSVVRSTVGIITQANNIIISLSNECLSQFKAYASAAVQAYKKDQSKTESTELEGGSWQEYLKEQGIEL